jgi:hypothetical protein
MLASMSFKQQYLAFGGDKGIPRSIMHRPNLHIAAAS